MHLFLDANIYLGFYKLSGDDLEELRKLVAMVRSGDIVLYLPEQVRNEFVRNRAGVIDESLRAVEQARIPKGYPELIRNLGGYKEMRENADRFEQQRGALVEEARRAAEARDLDADRLIKDLFESAREVPLTDEILSAAKKRSLLGNPPGKKDSIGDAVNWESLLATVPAGEDLIIVSADGDYASDLEPTQLDEFLQDEWAGLRGTKITLYDSLTSALKDNYPEIKLAADVEKGHAINRLISSPNFRGTHLAIQQLSEYADFTPSEATSLAEAALANSQIRMIFGDPDVHEFYTNLLERYGEHMPPLVRDALRDDLDEAEAEREESEDY